MSLRGKLLRLRTPTGEEVLDLAAFEARAARGEVSGASEVCVPELTGERFVRAEALELTRRVLPRSAEGVRRWPARVRFPRLTAALVLAEVALFAAMRARGPIDQGVLVAWGAKVAPLILEVGETWRLLAANLIHESALHIAFNLFVLFLVGGALEQVYRPLDYGLLLLSSALGTTLTSLLALPQSVTAGSSGVVYGALGAAAVFGMRHRELVPERYRRLIGEATLPAVLVFFYVGFTASGVDSWAHLGGLGAGAAMALALPPRASARADGAGARLARASPFAIAAAGLAVGGALLARGPARAREVRDDALGIALEVPALWRRGPERLGQMGFTNGLGGAARASVAVQVRPAGAGELERAPSDYAARELAPAERAGELKELALEAPRGAALAARPALRLDGAFSEEGARMRLRAYFLARGEILQEVVFRWPARYGAYERRVDEMAASLRWTEPAAVREARERARREPGAASLMALAATLRRVGDLEGATAALEEAARRGPEGAAELGELARALVAQGLLEQGCALAAKAEARAPGSPSALEAQADCAAGRGDRAAMRGFLERAAAAAPSDERLRARLGEVPENGR